MRRLRRDESGFTMVELLVVIGVILLLTAIAVPIWLNQRQLAWENAVKTTVSNASQHIMANKPAQGFQDYTQSPTTPLASGIPGFPSGESVELVVYGAGTLGKDATCIQGYNQMRNPPQSEAENYHNSRWHVTVSSALNIPMPYKVSYENGARVVSSQQEKLGELLQGPCIVGMDVSL